MSRKTGSIPKLIDDVLDEELLSPCKTTAPPSVALVKRRMLDMADDISGRVLNPGSLIDYQDDSIVSRALLKEKAGSVTLFAFDEGQELSEHTTPYDALVEVIDGEAEIAIAGEPLRLNPGMMIVMPANVPHAVSAVARFKMILTMIRS